MSVGGKAFCEGMKASLKSDDERLREKPLSSHRFTRSLILNPRLNGSHHLHRRCMQLRGTGGDDMRQRCGSQCRRLARLWSSLGGRSPDASRKRVRAITHLPGPLVIPLPPPPSPRLQYVAVRGRSLPEKGCLLSPCTVRAPSWSARDCERRIDPAGRDTAFSRLTKLL